MLFLELSDFVLYTINLLIFISKLTVSYEITLFHFVSASSDFPTGKKQFLCPVRPSEICGEISGFRTGFPFCTLVFPCQYHAITFSYSLESTCCSYEDEKANLPNTL